MEAAFTAPAGAERLFDRVHVTDPRLRPVFYWALRDTLVAPTLDAARSIAYRGNRAVFRVVTLDGMLIDSAGTMAGGGAAQRRGLMRIGGAEPPAGAEGEETAEKAVEALEAEVARLSREFEAKSGERAEVRVGASRGDEW